MFLRLIVFRGRFFSTLVGEMTASKRALGLRGDLRLHKFPLVLHALDLGVFLSGRFEFAGELRDVDLLVGSVIGERESEPLGVERFDLAVQVGPRVEVGRVLGVELVQVDVNLDHRAELIELFLRIHARELERVEREFSEDLVEEPLRGREARAVFRLDDERGPGVLRELTDDGDLAELELDVCFQLPAAYRLRGNVLRAGERVIDRVQDARLPRSVRSRDLDDVTVGFDRDDLELFDVLRLESKNFHCVLAFVAGMSAGSGIYLASDTSRSN